MGQTVKLSFDIDSREFNGRWYVDIRAWKAEPADAAMAQPGAPAAAPGFAPAASYGAAPQMPQGYATPAGAPTPPPAVDLAPSATDDLPF